jgi:hypothetical protein
MRRFILRTVLTAATIASIAAGWFVIRSREHLTVPEAGTDSSADVVDAAGGTGETAAPRNPAGDVETAPTPAVRTTNARPSTRTRQS